MTRSRAPQLAVSFGFTLLGLVFLFAAFAGKGGGQGNLAAGDTPDALPRILLFAWVGLGIADLLRQFLAMRAADAPPEADEPGKPAVLTVMALSLVLAISIVFGGYLLPILICLPLILFMTGTRSPLALALAFLVLGPGLWFLFHHLLQIRLPVLLSGGVL